VFVAPLFSRDDDEELPYYLGSQVELRADEPAPSLLRRVGATQAVRTLSKRQVEVLRLVAHGLRNKQIAHQLGLTEKTVKMHRAITMEKLGTRTAAEMIRLAVEAGCDGPSLSRAKRYGIRSRWRPNHVTGRMRAQRGLGNGSVLPPPERWPRHHRSA
jgi:DNA-binding CsgD family transcriptional regulator